MAMAGITGQCGGIKDARLRRSLLAFLNREGTLPYRAHARALDALGGQVNRGDFDLLKAHAEKALGGWRGLVRSGAIRGLCQLSMTEAYQWILQRVEPGAEPEYSRAECVRCLGTAAFWLDNATQAYAKSKSVELLQDSDYSVRMGTCRSH